MKTSNMLPELINKRKVQEMSHSDTTAKQYHQEEKKNDSNLSIQVDKKHIKGVKKVLPAIHRRIRKHEKQNLAESFELSIQNVIPRNTL